MKRFWYVPFRFGAPQATLDEAGHYCVRIYAQLRSARLVSLDVRRICIDAPERDQGERSCAQNEGVRMSCPFYGKSHAAFWNFGILWDQHGNECALIDECFAPCETEMAGQQPDWPSCPLNGHESHSLIQLRRLENLRAAHALLNPPEGGV